MAYFFRRSASFGPLRLNFSKSGIGASVGVKGARLTVTPRGTTYVTVGRNGFYYRETISTPPERPPCVPAASTSAGEIPTAHVSDLVDSSTETLVMRLNERARMFNPAWLWYVAAALTVAFAAGLLANEQGGAGEPKVPMYGAGAYERLVGLYGYPDSVRIGSPNGLIPVRNARYGAAQVSVSFVPAACAEQYDKVMEVIRDQSRYPALTKQALKKLRPCAAASDALWSAVEYTDSNDNTKLAPVDVAVRLGAHKNETQKYSVVQQAVAHLSKTHRIWRITADAPTSDWKRNAGASSLVKRHGATIGHSNPPRVQANLRIPSVGVGAATMYFLPDVILYREHGSFGAISYQDFQVEQGSTRFIEDGSVPGDTNVVGTTWRYVNKSGGPDRRFNNNAQLAVVQYGTLALRSSTGLNVHLQTSSLDASIAFANCWRELRGRTARPYAAKPTGGFEKPHTPDSLARQVLGVGADASLDEISASYKRLVQMYHPDKVAGLAPEFQTIANERMKEINAAYEVLKRADANR